jgi:dTDP-4-amino-4,6-dideoxygalactose transaminase
MIRINDFISEPPELQREELTAVERVFRSGFYILGKEVQQFEEAWAKFCSAPFCVGVANGMEAIELGLRALDIGPGDEVVTTPMTAVATVFAIIQVGATPVMADVDPESVLLDLESVERCLTPSTKAILLVHLYGQVRALETWASFCEKKKIPLLEDCAQAHGARSNSKHAGTFGTWGAFSFYPTKNLGAKGDAGAIVTSSEKIAARVKSLRNLGTTKRYEHSEPGFNSRLDELQAAILSTRLPWLERFNARRREIAKRYFTEITSPRIQLLSPPIASENHVYHLFVVRCAERDRLAHFLKEREIETLIHYPIPVHRQECCRDVRRDPRGLTNAETHATQCLSVPCHPQLRDEDVTAIIAAVNQFE